MIQSSLVAEVLKGMRVKICGITKADQGRAIAELGASALGFICVPASPRYVPPEQIASIVSEIPWIGGTKDPICDRIGVFVNARLDQICEVVTSGHLNGVQLHGDESPEFCDTLRHQIPDIEIIKALRVKTPDTLEQALIYANHVDTLLLDAYHPTLPGGTGQTIDWQWLRSFQPPCPWLLAGGLNPDNVGAAVQALCPAGIDLSSGVEKGPGDKDIDAIAKLFQRLRSLKGCDFVPQSR